VTIDIKSNGFPYLYIVAMWIYLHGWIMQDYARFYMKIWGIWYILILWQYVIL